MADGFEPVRAEFEANFVKRGEVGASLCVLIDGKPVVDLWGGASDTAQTQAWQADTLVNVWSSTKGWLALAMHTLADQGLLDFEAPVAQYWPEFAQHGKDRVLVKHLLTHTAGLPGVSVKVPDDTIYDWNAMIRALEQSELFWEPGTQCGYHAGSFGWLNGEVIRRITGMPVSQYLRTKVAEPLGADLCISLSPEEEARTANIIPPSFFGNMMSQMIFALGGKVRSAAFRNPPRPIKAANTIRWRQATIPSSNGHASARGLARLYIPLACEGMSNGVRFLSKESVERARREAFTGKDAVIGMTIKRSLGYMLADPDHGDPRPASALGHPGMGGSVGFADPQHHLTMGYVMNQMRLGMDDRWPSLARTVYACLNQA